MILPGRATEYRCSYVSAATAFTVAFENQNGWRFAVKLGPDDRGEWRAEKDGEALKGCDRR